MNPKFLLTSFLLIALNICFGQKNSKWDKWNWLMGEWAGEGRGKTGQGTGIFSLKPDLDEKILIRKNHFLI